MASEYTCNIIVSRIFLVHTITGFWLEVCAGLLFLAVLFSRPPSNPPSIISSMYEYSYVGKGCM